MSRLTPVSMVVLCASFAHAQVLWDESVNGDLSGDRFAPTSLGALAPGAWSVAATSVSGDLEYYTFTIPAGASLVELRLVAFSHPSTISFVAVQHGAVFTEPAVGTNPANLLGWTHFGNTQLGTDILDNLGAGPGSQGFSPPLPSGDYVFWSQETGPSAVSYRFEFHVVPASATTLALALAIVPCARRRR